MKTKPIELRVPERLGIQIKKEAFRHSTHEYVVFALVSHAQTRDKTLLLVKKVFTLEENEYFDSLYHGAMWRGASTIRIINEAIQDQLGIVIIHAHLFSKRVGLSRDDIQSANSLLPCYQNLIPTRPHGSVVLGEDCAAGVILLPESDRFEQLENLRWLGKKMANWTVFQNNKVTKSNDLYHRQTLLIGRGGQTALSLSKVAVVGLSGGGSHVVQQLAHLGIGEIIGIDKERGESTNRHRVIGLGSRDVALKRKKVTVMANMVRQINADLKFTEVPFNIPEQEAIDQLKRADIVVGCVDNLLARADVHELCQRYLIPYVDVGLLIIPDESGIGVQAIGGNVFTVIPGGICMFCNGQLSQKKLDAETGGRPRSYFQGTDKQAQVVSFNGLLASAAVNEVLQMLTGFAPVDDESYTMRKFDGFSNTLEAWSIKPNSSCPSCMRGLASGDPVWTDVET